MSTISVSLSGRLDNNEDVTLTQITSKLIGILQEVALLVKETGCCSDTGTEDFVWTYKNFTPDGIRTIGNDIISKLGILLSLKPSIAMTVVGLISRTEKLCSNLDTNIWTNEMSKTLFSHVHERLLSPTSRNDGYKRLGNLTVSSSTSPLSLSRAIPVSPTTGYSTIKSPIQSPVQSFDGDIAYRGKYNCYQKLTEEVEDSSDDSSISSIGENITETVIVRNPKNCTWTLVNIIFFILQKLKYRSLNDVDGVFKSDNAKYTHLIDCILIPHIDNDLVFGYYAYNVHTLAGPKTKKRTLQQLKSTLRKLVKFQLNDYGPVTRVFEHPGKLLGTLQCMYRKSHTEKKNEHHEIKKQKT